MENKILLFIEHFKKYDGVRDCFIDDMSYWFAHILYYRFRSEAHVALMYNSTLKSFGCKIDGNIYNIDGIVVNNNQEWREWNGYGRFSSAEAQLIYKNYIRKEGEN